MKKTIMWLFALIVCVLSLSCFSPNAFILRNPEYSFTARSIAIIPSSLDTYTLANGDNIRAYLMEQNDLFVLASSSYDPSEEELRRSRVDRQVIAVGRRARRA